MVKFCLHIKDGSDGALEGLDCVVFFLYCVGQNECDKHILRHPSAYLVNLRFLAAGSYFAPVCSSDMVCKNANLLQWKHMVSVSVGVFC